jgi:histidinol-phosphatase (PHP family)
MDYLALGQHYIEKGRELISVYRISSLEDLTIYKDTMIAAFKTGYFKFVCHPDIFLFSQKKLSEDILKLCEEIIISAKENNVLLEINANGFRKGSIQVDGEIRYRYPRYEFWKLVKKHNAKCIISSDAHKPEFLYDGYIEEAFKFSRTLSLEVEEVIL